MPVHPTRRRMRRAICTEGLCRASITELSCYLRERGYATTTIGQYVAIVKRFYEWLSRPQNRRRLIGEASIIAFIRYCRTVRPLRHLHHIRSGLRRLTQMLHQSGDSAVAGVAPTAIDTAIAHFIAHLRGTAGLAESTCTMRAMYIRQFLQSTFGTGPLRFNRLGREDLERFITDYARRWSPASIQVVTSSLRAYLRYLQLRGIRGGQLLAAVPSLPSWKLARLPRTMTKEQRHTYLSAFDGTTAVGRRDYAMALLMSTLGLRAGEVALLQLNDLDWRASVLRVVIPKSRRTRVLPLPVQVGRAIADYIRYGRPTTSHRHVFVRHVALKGHPLNAGLIRAVTIRTFRRCGFDSRWNGTHILRHTAATLMYQRGATLKDVADLLGHRSIETSTIYTKVNLPALAAVALPWPEVAL